MWKLALMMLAACGGKQTDDSPRCIDAFDALAKRLGDPESPALAPMIGACEQQKWPRAVRTCVAEAANAEAVMTCVKPIVEERERAAKAADAKAIGPAPTPSAETKKELARGPVRVTVFAPEKDEVADRIAAYFKALGITVERADRLLAAEAGAKYRVSRDVTIVLARDSADGERWFTVEVDVEPKRAARGLANLDREVQHTLVKLFREKRKLYVTTGHGEAGKDSKPERSMKTLERYARDMNFEKLDLGILELAKDVPADATVVAILGPSTAFSANEQAALDRYLDRGGAMIVAYEPDGIDSLGVVDTKLGVKRLKGHLTDDKSFLPQRKAPSDHRFVVTNKYGVHPTVTSLARSAGGTVMVDAGALEAITTTAKTTPVIESMDSSFIDLDDDFTFDDRKEQRQHWDVAFAVEAKYRALVIADADMFADALVAGSAGQKQVRMIGGPLFLDTLRWLAGEEKLVGEVVADEPEEPREKPNPGRRALENLRELLTK